MRKIIFFTRLYPSGFEGSNYFHSRDECAGFVGAKKGWLGLMCDTQQFLDKAFKSMSPSTFVCLIDVLRSIYCWGVIF